MGKVNTYFEQVPLVIAKQVANEEARLWKGRLVMCAICGSPVELEQCKSDENGDAVHDKCYFAKVTAATKPRPSKSA